MAGWNDFAVHMHPYEDEPVIAFRMSGALTNSKESYEFLDELRALLRREPRSVILNLGKVEHITSAGVGIVAAAFTSAVNAQSKLVICDLPKQVETVLNLVNLTSVVPHYGTEEQALAGLRA
jgi:stage II sporulation protein AA (anti-sigma F factor antagonist)